ncbi:MAG: aminotransferase class V-fold PLP-dependent enzyme [Verrucomicrobiota bacterium]
MPYFDHNATTPLSGVAREAWLETQDKCWQNPSSLYRGAAMAHQVLEDARERVADLLDVEPIRVVFTSGATEANSAVLAWFGGLREAVGISPFEHPCVREPAERWFGGRCFEVDSADVGAFLESKNPALFAMMAASNETGVVLPWQESVAKCRAFGVPFLCDAVQWIGKMPLKGLDSADYVVASGHKFGGPKGVGFLLVPEQSGIRLQSGGPQEERRRAGTEDLAGVVAMVAALEELEGKGGSPRGRAVFEERVLQELPGTEVVGRGEDRLWNTSMLVMPDFDNRKWLSRLDRRGFQVSTGAACSTGSDGPTLALAAMGYQLPQMKRVLRFSGGWETSEDDWRALAEAVVEVFVELSGSGKKSTSSALAPGGG